jgi:hypothetical protein
MKVLRTSVLTLMSVLALLFALPLLAHASPASTESQDGQYISMLLDNGVPVTTASAQASAVKLGHTIVEYLATNPTDEGVTLVVLTGIQSFEKAGIPTDVAAHYVAVTTYSAVYVYAPSLLPVLKHWAQTHSNTGNALMVRAEQLAS